MLPPESPLIPVFSQWFGSWQLRLERRPLSIEALAASYDQAAPRWSRITNRYGYSVAYEELLKSFLAQSRVPAGTHPLRVLDCGVGTGDFALALCRVLERPVEITAVDISPAMVEHATARFRAAGLAATVVHADLRALPFADASFDLVLAAHVLEHLPKPVDALTEFRRVLTPGGSAVTCLTRQSWLGAYIQTKWRTHRLTSERASQWLAEAGFDIAPVNVQPRGIFNLTSLAAVGRKGYPFGTITENTL